MNRSIKMRQQAGVALVISLLMLVVLTIIAISSINTTSVDTRIAYNNQLQREAEAAAQQAIDQALSTIAFYYTPATPPPQTIDTCGNGLCPLSVTLTAPTCLLEKDMEGEQSYSALYEQAPKENSWQFTATAKEATGSENTGVNVQITQGVSIRMLADHCP